MRLAFELAGVPEFFRQVVWSLDWWSRLKCLGQKCLILFFGCRDYEQRTLLIPLRWTPHLSYKNYS